MPVRWLILADDRTGAADCAVAFARRGWNTAVGWRTPLSCRGSAAIYAHDVESRGLGPEAAAARHAEAIRVMLEPGTKLFTKIDSGLRGQPAHIIAATAAHFAQAGAAALGILAPAFPATGRITINGCIRLGGVPLEQTELWRREHSYPDANLVTMVMHAGLTAAKVGLRQVRSQSGALRAVLAGLAEDGCDVAVCDAETDDDLARIAAAGMEGTGRSFFIGSGGLAHALSSHMPAQAEIRPDPRSEHGGGLIVVGSLAEMAHAASRRLTLSGIFGHVPIAPADLAAPDRGAALGDNIARRLNAGEDLLVELLQDGSGVPDGRLVGALAATLNHALKEMGSLAAIGGDTAAALLEAMDVRGLQVVRELDPGVVLSVSLGPRIIPIITKAGAFGDAESLCRVAGHLHRLRRGAT